jgi:RNA polymerase sigma-70 factor (ECF subfamily)
MLSQNNSRSVIQSVGDSAAVKALILKAKKGDKDAFGELYTILYKPLYRYVYSRSSDEDLALDLVQQTFLKFYESLATYTYEKSPLAYLFTIAKHLLINHREKKTHTHIDEELLDSLGEQSTILEDTHTHQLAEKINEYLPQLTADEEDVIRLFFYSELSYKEIRDILDKEEVYLRKIKERALKKLRILTKHLYEEHA